MNINVILATVAIAEVRHVTTCLFPVRYSANYLYITLNYNKIYYININIL